MILAIHGLKGSGKDEFYKILKTTDKGKDYIKLAFADPIKRNVQHIFNLDTQNDNEYDQFKRSEFTLTNAAPVLGRHILREIGMLMRSYDDGLQFRNYVHENLQENTCITDLRLQSELEYFQELKLSRPGQVKLIKIKRIINKDPNEHIEVEVDDHITERDLPDEFFDFIIENTTLESYHLNVKCLIDVAL